MANSFSLSNMATRLMLWLLISTISLHLTVAEVGVCYGRLGRSLPPPKTVVAMYKRHNIKKMRLYDPDPSVLTALCGSGIEVMVGIPDADLPNIAECQCNADEWVKNNIERHPGVEFRYIAVGNEVNTSSSYAASVLPAMQYIYKALCDAGLDGKIAVSTSIRTDLLARSYPPSAGEFKPEISWFIKPIVDFLSDTGANLLVNVYPYFAYMEDPINIKRCFALLQPGCGQVLGGVYYDNLFYAMFDAVIAAMEKIRAPSSLSSLGDSKSQSPSGTVSETGDSTLASPSPPPKRHGRRPPKGGRPQSVGDGDGDGEWGSIENARIYATNLMRVVKEGTPKRPGIPIETYLFAMFDEDLKPGPEYERHFGIFWPNGRCKYPINFN